MSLIRHGTSLSPLPPGLLRFSPKSGFLLHLRPRLPLSPFLEAKPRKLIRSGCRPRPVPDTDLEHQGQRSNPKHPRKRSLLTQGLEKKEARLRLRRVKRALASCSAHLPSLDHPRLTTLRLRITQITFYSQMSLNANDLPVMLNWEAVATSWTIQELKARASKFVEWDGK